MVEELDDVEGAASPINNAMATALLTQNGELFYMIHELSRLISSYFDRAMEKHQLTRAQWWGMMHVSEREGATQTELANLMQMGRASTGKLIDRLEAKGWLERRPDAADNRLRRVYLTSNANAVHQVMAIEGSNLFRDFLTGISAEEQDAMLAGLRRMKANGDRQQGGAGVG